MNETEVWIEQARACLKTARRSGRQKLLDELAKHMDRIDLDRAQAELGCGDRCAECSWGHLGGHPLGDTCRLVAFQRALDDLRAHKSHDGPAPSAYRRVVGKLLRRKDLQDVAGPQPVDSGQPAKVGVGSKSWKEETRALLELLNSVPARGGSR